MLREIVKSILRPMTPSAWCYVCGKWKGYDGRTH